MPLVSGYSSSDSDSGADSSEEAPSQTTQPPQQHTSQLNQSAETARDSKCTFTALPQAKQRKQKRRVNIRKLPSLIEERKFEGISSDDDSAEEADASTGAVPTKRTRNLKQGFLNQLPAPKSDPTYSRHGSGPNNALHELLKKQMQKNSASREEPKPPTKSVEPDDCSESEEEEEGPPKAPRVISSAPSVSLAATPPAPPAVRADPLPEGWSTAIDKTSGDAYYFHAATARVTWDRPGGIERTAGHQASTRQQSAKAQGPQQAKPKISLTGDIEMDRQLQRDLDTGIGMEVLNVDINQLHDANKWMPSEDAQQRGKRKASLEASTWNHAAGKVTVSGLPNKMQKRKHQLHSLAFQAQERELELAEMRSRGQKTKAQTYGRYGW